MKNYILFSAALCAVLTSTKGASAQSIPVRAVSTASAVSSEPFRAVGSVRELPNGNVLVNDIIARRILLMDSTMHLLRVVVDSAATDGSDTYGTRPGALVPYRADTTIFIDPVAYSMLMIDGSGKVVRARSVWRAQDAATVASPGSAIGQIGTDSRGRIVYRVAASRPNTFVRSADNGPPVIPPTPDSAFIVAADPDTRKIDTLAVIKVPSFTMHVTGSPGRGMSISPVINPLPITDEWAVLPDGRVAFVRGRDYRVEYLNGDGTITSSAKLPFDWQRLSDEDKQRLIDSTKVAMQKVAINEYATNMIRWVNQTGKEYPKDFTIPEGFVPMPGLPKDAVLPPGVTLPQNYIYACPPGADNAAPTMIMAGPPPGAVAAGGNVTMTRVQSSGDGPGALISATGCVPAPVMFSTGGPLPPPTPRTVEVVNPTDLPDYRPPFPQGSVRADRDGNLWIRANQMKPVAGGPVFDIVSPKGELVDRIQLPSGYAVAGFGKDKVVYLTSRDAAGIHIARVHLK